MNTINRNEGPGGRSIVQSLCIVLFVILVRTYCVGTLDWYWIIPMCGVLISIYYVASLPSQKKKSEGVDLYDEGDPTFVLPVEKR